MKDFEEILRYDMADAFTYAMKGKFIVGDGVATASTSSLTLKDIEEAASLVDIVVRDSKIDRRGAIKHARELK